MSSSLVIRRLEEKVGETDYDLKKLVKGLEPFREALRSSEFYFFETKVKSVKRLGWRFDGQTARGDFWKTPRLVLVEFVDLASKMHVKRNSWRIRTWDEESVVSFDHALTVEQRRIHAAQWPKIKDAKQKGLRWFWSDVVPHRLIVSGEGRLKVNWLGDNEAAWPC